MSTVLLWAGCLLIFFLLIPFFFPLNSSSKLLWYFLRSIPAGLLLSSPLNCQKRHTVIYIIHHEQPKKIQMLFIHLMLDVYRPPRPPECAGQQRLGLLTTLFAAMTWLPREKKVLHFFSGCPFSLFFFFLPHSQWMYNLLIHSNLFFFFLQKKKKEILEKCSNLRPT